MDKSSVQCLFFQNMKDEEATVNKGDTNDDEEEQ